MILGDPSLREFNLDFAQALAMDEDRIMHYKASPLKRIYLRLTLPIWKVTSLIRFWLTGDCGNACGHVKPYGFVPEAGCPVHDGDD